MRKTALIIFLAGMVLGSPAQSNTKTVSAEWFDTCTPEEIIDLLKDTTFHVNMVFGTQDEYNGETPLMHAVKNKNPEVTALLLNSGADVNAGTDDVYENTAAVFAVSNPNEQVLKLLIAAGADMKYTRWSYSDSERGYSLLHFASANPNPEIFKLLLENDANPLLQDEMGGNTVLMNCARLNTNPKVFSVLLDAGLDINTQNDFGQTALTIAIENNTNPEVIKFLIDKGGDLSIESGIFEKKNILELAEANPALKNSYIIEFIREKYYSLEK